MYCAQLDAKQKRRRVALYRRRYSDRDNSFAPAGQLWSSLSHSALGLLGRQAAFALFLSASQLRTSRSTWSDTPCALHLGRSDTSVKVQPKSAVDFDEGWQLSVASAIPLCALTASTPLSIGGLYTFG